MMAEDGLYPKYAALSAIEQHNNTHHTYVEYEEIRDIDSTYIPCGAGEWLVWVDNQSSILLGDYDDPMEAMEHCDCEWAILQIEGCLHIIRSPHKGGREYGDAEGLDGMEKGPHLAMILPPEIEAAIRQDLDPDMPETVYIEQSKGNYNVNDRINY